MDPQLKHLLQQYSHIFATPSTLPPCRNHNHVISMKECAPPVKVQPYRYPHSQK